MSQAFCSALPVAYTKIAGAYWMAFACLVLEAAYEATIWAAINNAQRGRSNIVLLNSAGRGRLRNREEWIEAAMRRALQLVVNVDLDVRLVTYGAPSEALARIIGEFG